MRRMDLALALVALALPAAACGGGEPRLVFPSSHIPVAPLPSPSEPEDSEEAPAPKLSMAEVQREAVDEALAALNAHDAKRFASMYAEDAVVSVAGLDDVSGRAAIERNMSEWFQTFKDLRLGVSRVWAKGDTLALEWVMSGVHHGELFGVKGTDRPIGHRGLSVVTFDGRGKIASEHRYGELGAVMEQIKATTKAKAPPIPEVPAAPERFASTGASEEEKNLEVANAVFGSLEPGKKEADLLSLLADEIEQRGLAPDPSKGKAGAKALHKAFTTAFPDAKLETKRALAVGEYVIVESVLEATHKGPLGKIAPTKKPIKLHVAGVLHVKDGRVTRAWAHHNRLELDAQLGRFRIPGAASTGTTQ